MPGVAFGGEGYLGLPDATSLEKIQAGMDRMEAALARLA